MPTRSPDLDGPRARRDATFIQAGAPRRIPSPASPRSGHPATRFVIVALALALAATAWPEPVPADTYDDDFASGLDPAFWELSTDQPLYVVDDTDGAVEISKPVGGDYALQIQQVSFRPPLLGDFSVEVLFTEALVDRIDGMPGNQVQLNVALDGVAFSLVRSDESHFGHNVHVFVVPPTGWAGTRAVTATEGHFRIERTGSTLSGYFDGALIHTQSFTMGAEARVWLSLQNNGTRDSTHVVFDDFAASSDEILGAPTNAPAPPSTPILQLSSNPVRESVWIGWEAPRGGAVDLRIYDARGREVAHLVDGIAPAVTGRVAWRPPARLASGVYRVRLSSERAPAIVRSVTVIR